MNNYTWRVEIKDRTLEQVIHVTADRMQVTPTGHLVFFEGKPEIITHVQAYGSYRGATIVSSCSPIKIVEK